MNNNIHPEERLQKAMLAFEREQAKKKLRPTLPCDVNRPRPVVERMNELKRRRDEVYVRLLRWRGSGRYRDCRTSRHERVKLLQFFKHDGEGWLHPQDPPSKQNCSMDLH